MAHESNGSDLMMKWLFALLVVIFLSLQYKLWLGQGGLRDVKNLSQLVDQARVRIKAQKERNNALTGEVRDLKSGKEAIEERARSELGMIRKGETFFQVIKKPTDRK
jgi:cell division protein FtsB